MPWLRGSGINFDRGPDSNQTSWVPYPDAPEKVLPVVMQSMARIWLSLRSVKAGGALCLMSAMKSLIISLIRPTVAAVRSVPPRS